MDSGYSIINIYDKLLLKYKEYLKPDIISISILQSRDEVLLESVELEILEDGLEKEIIKRVDLSIIRGDEEEAFFSLEAPIEINARRFINEISPYSIVNTTDLFRMEASDKISKKYNYFGIDK